MKKIDLTKGKVINVLTVLALPIMATSLLQFTYNLIDMLWVGALGSDAVASVGSSSFFVGLGYAINSMVVIGTTIKLAQAIGRKETEKEKEYINAGLVINFLLCRDGAQLYFTNGLDLCSNDCIRVIMGVLGGVLR